MLALPIRYRHEQVICIGPTSGTWCSNLEDLSSRGIVLGFDAASISRVMADRTLTSTMIDDLLGLELNLKAIDQLADPGARALAAP